MIPVVDDARVAAEHRSRDAEALELPAGVVDGAGAELDRRRLDGEDRLVLTHRRDRTVLHCHGPRPARPAARGPAARARRRAHAARRPGGELLVPPAPGGLRVDRRARGGDARGRSRVRRGLRRRRCSRAGRARSWGSSRIPRRTSMRGAVPGRRRSGGTSRRRSWSRATPSCSCRRSSTSRIPAAVLDHIRAQLRPGGVAFVSTPNVLTLAPAGAERSDNPWHVREYRPEEFRALCSAASGRSSCSGCSTRGSACARGGALAGVGPRASGAAAHAAVLRPLRPGDLQPGLRRAAGATGAVAGSGGRVALSSGPSRSFVEPRRAALGDADAGDDTPAGTLRGPSAHRLARPVGGTCGRRSCPERRPRHPFHPRAVYPGRLTSSRVPVDTTAGSGGTRGAREAPGANRRQRPA